MAFNSSVNSSLPDNYAATLSEGWRNDDPAIIVGEAESASIQGNVIADACPTENITPQLQHISLNTTLPDNYAATLSEGWRNDNPAIIVGEAATASIGGNVIVDSQNLTEDLTPQLQRRTLNSSLPDNYAATLSEGWRNDDPAIIVGEAESVSIQGNVIADAPCPTENITPHLQHRTLNSSLPDNYAATLSEGWRNDDPAIIVGEAESVSIQGNVIADAPCPTENITPQLQHISLNTTLPDNCAATLSEGWRNDDPAIIVGEAESVSIQGNVIIDPQNPTEDLTQNDGDTDSITEEKQLLHGQPGELEGMEDWMVRHGGQSHADDEAYLQTAKATAALTVEKKDNTRRTVAASDVDAEIKYGDRDEIDFRGGHDNEFVEELTDYNCHFCQMPRRDPVQVKGCGHSYCKSCWVYWHSYNGDETTGMCIMCDTSVKLANVFLDVNQDRIIKSQKVYCPNKEEGCDVTIALWDLNEIHMPRCGYQTIQCDLGCEESMLRKDLTRHVADECPHRLIRCPLCDLELKSLQMEEHSVNCPMKEVVCDFCKSEGLLNKALAAHHETECPDLLTHCSLAPLGCVEKIARSDLPTHHKVNTPQHVALINSAMALLIDGEDSTSDNTVGPVAQYELPHHMWQRVRKFEKLATNQEIVDTNVKLTNEVGTLTEKNLELQKEIANIKETYTVMVREHEHKMQEQNKKIQMLEDVNQQFMKLCEDIEKKVGKLEKGMKGEKGGSEVKGGEVQVGACGGGPGIAQAGGGGSVGGGGSSVGGQVVGVSGGMVGVAQQSGGGVGKIVEIREGVRVTCPCYWECKVTRYMEDVVSPPFYTKDGYRMCLRVACDGSGLYVDCRLMKGERDGELRWPWAGAEVMTVREVGSGRQLVGECGVVGVGDQARGRPQRERNGESLFYNWPIPYPGDGVTIEITVE